MRKESITRKFVSLSSRSISETSGGSGHHRNGRLRILLAKTETRLAVVLSLLAFMLLVTMCFWAFVSPLTPGRMTKPSVELFAEVPIWSLIGSISLPFLQQPQWVAATMIFMSVVAFATYALAVYLCWNRQPHPRSLTVVSGAALLFFLVAAYALPNIDTDIYNYIVSARVAVVHDSNPYYIAPDDFPGDALYPYASKQYTDAPDNKLPTWMLFSMLVAGIAGDDPTINLLIFRFALLLVNVANIFLIIRILQRLNPRHILAGVTLYAWSPIVALRAVSKTDTIMIFLLLLAILLMITAHRRLAIVSLTLSAFVKLITLPLLAVYWLRQFKERQWRTLILEVLVVCITALVIYAPFLQHSTLIIEHIGFMREGGSLVPGAARIVVAAMFLGIMGWIGLTYDGSAHQLVRGWALVFLFFAIFLTRVQYSWYLMVPIALVALVGDWRMTVLIVALSWASFLFNAWDATSISGFQLPYLFPLPRYIVYLAFLTLVALGIAAVVAYKRSLHSQKLDMPRY